MKYLLEIITKLYTANFAFINGILDYNYNKQGRLNVHKILIFIYKSVTLFSMKFPQSRLRIFQNSYYLYFRLKFKSEEVSDYHII